MLAMLFGGLLLAATPTTAPDAAFVVEPVAAELVTPADTRRATTLDTTTVSTALPDNTHALRDATPGAVAIATADALRGRAVNNLADALRSVPGVWAASASGGAGLFLSIRGSNLDATDYDNNGVLLLVDGLPVSTADGNNHNRFIDPFVARDITVARGANALAWGASTLGGAIAVTSRTARNGNPRQVRVDAGSDGLRNVHASFGGSGEHFDAMVSASARQWDGYREHSRETGHAMRANFGWQSGPDTTLRLYATHIDDDAQLPGALTRDEFLANPRQANASNLRGNHQKNVTTDRVAATTHFGIDAASALDFGLSWERQTLFHPVVDVFVDTDGDPATPPIDVFSLLIDTHQRTAGASVRYHRDFGDHELVAGLNAARTVNRGGNYANQAGQRGALQDRVDARATTTTLFALDHWQLADAWRLTWGAQGVTSNRFDANVSGVSNPAATPRNQRDHYHAVNPRAGLIRDFANGTQAYANLSRLYQAPDSFDLDNARRERGPAATLDATHGAVAEIGLRGTLGTADTLQWQWDASAYSARLHDEIVSSDDPTQPGISLTSNAGRTRHAGVEIGAGSSVPVGAAGSRIEASAAFTWNDFRFDGDPVYGNRRLPNAPRMALHGDLTWRRYSGLFAGLTLDTTGTRYADYANTRQLGAYTLVGLRAGLRQASWELFAEARNLANRRYVSTLTVRDFASVNDAILQPGAPRSLFLGARFAY